VPDSQPIVSGIETRDDDGMPTQVRSPRMRTGDFPPLALAGLSQPG